MSIYAVHFCLQVSAPNEQDLEQLNYFYKSAESTFQEHPHSLPEWNEPKTTSSDTHICDVCGKSFTRHKNMLMHRKLHFGIYRCYCPICHKGFSGSTNLKGHMQIHTNTADFQCGDCNKAYRYAKDLKRHRQSMHNVSLTQENVHSLLLDYASADTDSERTNRQPNDTSFMDTCTSETARENVQKCLDVDDTHADDSIMTDDNMSEINVMKSNYTKDHAECAQNDAVDNCLQDQIVIE